MNKIYFKDKLFRSQVIRQTVEVITGYFRLTRSISDKNTQNNPLKELIGIEKSLTGTIGLQVDEIYRLDDHYSTVSKDFRIDEILTLDQGFKKAGLIVRSIL